MKTLLRIRRKKKLLSRYIKWLPKKNLFLSLSSALLFFLALPPFNLYFLGFIAFMPFFLIQEEQSKLSKLFLYGWFMGFALYFAGFFWLIETIEIFGGLPFPAAFLVYLLFCLFFSLKYGIFIWLANALQQYYHFRLLSYGERLLFAELFLNCFPFI